MPLIWFAYAVGGVGVLVEWRAYLQHCGQAFRKWSAAGAILWAAMYRQFLPALSSDLTAGAGTRAGCLAISA